MNALEIPRVFASSTSVVSVISKNVCPSWLQPGIVCKAPSTTTVTVALTLRTSFGFPKTHSTSDVAFATATRLDLPLVFTASTTIICVITEWTGPRGKSTPCCTRVTASLALWASFYFSKAQSVLAIVFPLVTGLDSPLIFASATSVVGVITKSLGPFRSWTPSATSVGWALALRASFWLFKADSEAAWCAVSGQTVAENYHENENIKTHHVYAVSRTISCKLSCSLDFDDTVTIGLY